jgi:hypothetical protein
VTLRYLLGGELLDGDRAPREPADALAADGLVIEVHLLPALTT